MQHPRPAGRPALQDTPGVFARLDLGSARFRGACLAFAFSLVINGCASVDKGAGEAQLQGPRPDPSALIIAPARFEPVAKIDPLLRTKEQAASEGARKGAGAMVSGPVSDPYALLLIPILVPIGAAIGAIVETSRAPSDEALAHAREAYAKAIAELRTQPRMQQAVTAALQAEGVGASLSVDEVNGPGEPADRPVYRDAAAPMVLELSVLEFGFSDRQGAYGEQTRTGKDGYALTLTTRARLVDTGRGTVIDEMQHFHRSEAFTRADWMEGEASRFRAELESAILRAADDIVLEFFLLYYPPVPRAAKDVQRAWGDVIPHYVLKPLYPEVRRAADLRGMFSDKFIGGAGGMAFTWVDDVRPTFRWEPFSAAAGATGSVEDRARITDVTYEIAVYDAQMNRLGGTVKYYAAGPLRYSRRGLTEPQHHMDEALEPCGRYAWTVRPRFKLDGHPRVGEWTGTYELGGFGPPPWKIRRALPPFETHGRGSSASFLLFRAPPPEGGGACSD